MTSPIRVAIIGEPDSRSRAELMALVEKVGGAVGQTIVLDSVRPDRTPSIDRALQSLNALTVGAFHEPAPRRKKIAQWKRR